MTGYSRNPSKIIRDDVIIIIITVLVGLYVLIFITALADASITGSVLIEKNLYGGLKVRTRVIEGGCAVLFAVGLWALCTSAHTLVKNELPEALLRRSLERSARRERASNEQ